MIYTNSYKFGIIYIEGLRNKENVEMIENKQVKNKINFYLDKVPENLKDSVLTTYCETCESIHSGIDNIYTTSLANMSFDLMDCGYDIFGVKNGKKIHFYPGMDNVAGKDIRKGHNLQRLIVSGFFNDDFECNEDN